MKDKVSILEEHADVIQAAREGISKELPSLWLSLKEVLTLQEASESSFWSAYKDGKLLLFSMINLLVKEEEKMKSITSIKQCLAGVGGAPGEYALNTHSLFLYDGAVELFTHSGIPFIFLKLYVYVDIPIEKYDPSVISHAYFDFILDHGFITMGGMQHLIRIKEQSEEKEKSPSLYSGLYKDQD